MNTSVAVVPPYLSRERVEGEDVRRDDDIRVTDADADDDRPYNSQAHSFCILYNHTHKIRTHPKSSDFTHVLAARNEEQNVRLLNAIYSRTPSYSTETIHISPTLYQLR